jgi:predicted flavoprotein YhiN
VEYIIVFAVIVYSTGINVSNSGICQELVAQYGLSSRQLKRAISNNTRQKFIAPNLNLTIYMTELN